MSRDDVIPWIPANDRTTLVQDGAQWAALASQVLAFRVVDDATAAHAHDMAKRAREAHRALEEKRKTITTPLLAAKNATDALFKPAATAILEIKTHYEQEIARYDLARERERARVLAESAAQIARNVVPTEPIPAPVVVENTTIRHRWEPEIVDPELVPREYWSPDLQKIREAVWYADTMHKEPRPIPGVRFVLKSTVTAR